LRPDYDYTQRLKVRDIVVITRQKPSAEDQAAPDGNRRFDPRNPLELAPLESTPPDGYRIFARRVTPRSWFLPNGFVTVIFAPAECGEMMPQRKEASP